MSGEDSWARLHVELFPDGPPKHVTLEEMDEAIGRAIRERCIRKHVRESDAWERVDEDAVVCEFSLDDMPTSQQIDEVVARLMREGGQSK